MRSPDLIKIQCFKSADQLCMLDLVIMGRAPNCFDKYEYIKLDVMLISPQSILQIFYPKNRTKSILI